MSSNRVNRRDLNTQGGVFADLHLILCEETPGVRHEEVGMCEVEIPHKHYLSLIIHIGRGFVSLVKDVSGCRRHGNEIRRKRVPKYVFSHFHVGWLRGREGRRIQEAVPSRVHQSTFIDYKSSNV